MNIHDGESISVWLDTHEMSQFSSLAEDLEVDVCIVGGGIGGLTTAYLLMKEGKSVCVLESFELGSGQTGRTTAHFVNALDDRFFELEKYFGRKGAILAAVSHTAAVDRVEKIVSEEKIDCEMARVPGYLFAQNDSRQDVLVKEVDAARRSGLVEARLVERCPFDSFDSGPAILFPNQLELHPLKYIDGLAKCIVQGGGRIFTQTHVVDLKGGKDAFVKTKNGFVVRCSAVVVATNSPINDRFAIHTKQAAYRTYVLGFRVAKGRVAKGLYWDTLDPYHYLRTVPYDDQHEILLIGGEDRKTGQDHYPADRFQTLEEWARERFPMAQDVLYRWSGQVMEPIDSLAFLGHNPFDRDNVYVMTGDSGNGMTHTTVGAILIVDQIMGRKNRWEDIYDPSRKTLRATAEFLRENGNVAAQYTDWLKAHPKGALEHLPRNEGIVVRDGARLIAAYRNENGEIETCSATCTHLGAVVSWNAVEKSWDCPAHGSRFDCHGRAIEGPACKNLKKIESVAFPSRGILQERETE